MNGTNAGRKVCALYKVGDALLRMTAKQAGQWNDGDGESIDWRQVTIWTRRTPKYKGVPADGPEGQAMLDRIEQLPVKRIVARLAVTPELSHEWRRLPRKDRLALRQTGAGAG